MVSEQNKRVAFELVDGIVLLPGMVGETKGFFAFDTGATRTVINQKYCDMDKALSADKDAITYDNDTKSSKVSKLEKITISYADEDTVIDNPTVMDMTYVETPLKKSKDDVVFLGSIGADLIGKNPLIVDYVNKEIVFNASEVPVSLKKYPIKVEMLPVIELGLGESKYRFVLDTGANHFLMDKESAPSDYVLSNNEAGATHIIPAFHFEDQEYKDITGVVTDISAIKNALHVDGVIGYQLLKDRICYFDYKSESLYM